MPRRDLWRYPDLRMAVQDHTNLPFPPAIRIDQLLDLGRDRGPYFAYDLAEVRKRFSLLTANFRGSPIYYAMKANPHPGILVFLRVLGARIEASSTGEVSKALEVGFRASEITLTGPGKTMHDLVYAVKKGVGYISVESLNEYRDLCAACVAPMSTTSALLRVNTPARNRFLVASARKEFDSFPSQLGMTISEAVAILREPGEAPIAGIHVYNGSQIVEESEFAERCHVLADSLNQLAPERREPLSVIQWGPGIGVPYSDGQTAVNIEFVAHALYTALNDFRRSGGVIALEVGRFLVGPAGVYVSRIARTREMGDRKLAVLEGGVHHFMRPSIATTGKHRVVALKNCSRSQMLAYSIVGPSGSPIDFFDDNVLLPELFIGDYLCFNNAGAYGKSMSLQAFISNLEADEILLDSDAKVDHELA
jgi:diaminopimelate decarboxylase